MKAILKVLVITWLAFWMTPEVAAQKKKKNEEKEDIKKMQEELMEELKGLPPEEAEQVKRYCNRRRKILTGPPIRAKIGEPVSSVL